jgi:Zn-dependent peptidase ImmA (M78 family)
LDDDRFYHATSTGDLYNSSIRRQHENQENAFAAWLLVPGEKLIEDIKNFAGNPD